jgi:hypothetical protein
MKQTVEKLSKLKIRQGFDKFLEKTLIYFNIKDKSELNKKLCIDIVQFINSSNSKVSIAYWILRKNCTQLEAEENKKIFANNFIESSYKHTNRRTVQHKHQTKNFSRGYSGYVIINDKKYYCRSQCEFIILKYLYKYYNDYRIEMEDKIFYLGDISYKPDFFMYKNNILCKVIEVKSNNKNLDDKYELFKKYFESIKIEYELIYDINLILKQNKDIKLECKEWKKDAFIECDMRGENNPRFGAVMSESTIEKIRQKAIERCENPEYTLKLSKSRKEAFKNNPQMAADISKRQKEKYEKIRQEKDLNDPIIECKCAICTNIFKKRTSSEKMTCSGKCTLEYNLKNNISINGYKIKIFNGINKYNGNIDLENINNVIKYLKENKLIPLNFGLNIQTINKYFNNFEQFKKELNDYNKNKKDGR